MKKGDAKCHFAVYVRLLMLKEIFTQSDEEAIHSLLFDIRYQYALHTTSFEEQPISKNSLSNFRTAVYKYNEEHNVDLIKEEGHWNVTIYRSQDKDLNTKLNTLTADAIELYYLCVGTAVAESEDFLILSLMLTEQTRQAKRTLSNNRNKMK